MRSPLPLVVVVGAGAAGLLAALFAARRGLDVVLIEGTKDGGRKILISGGGRCNILPSVVEPERYVTDSSRSSLRKMLRSWPLQEQRAFFERELGMKLVLEEESGKLFPESNRARDVRDKLMASVRDAGARVWFETRVRSVKPRLEPECPWELEMSGGRRLQAAAVILATGGLSVPATGSDGAGLEMVRRLGHQVNATYPALTPLTAQPVVHDELAGISLDVTIRAPGYRPRFLTQGGFLFTHRGYSGPAVLDASHLAHRSRVNGGERQALTVQWTPLDREEWFAVLQSDRGRLGPLLARHVPARLVRRLLQESGLPYEHSLAELGKRPAQRLITNLVEYPLPWTGDEGYKKAEVTGGGVALSEVHPVTMESRRHPGLYLCGEILDAFGPIGGHNFLWAWATGRAAGRAVLANG
jgi:hypothetical protein